MKTLTRACRAMTGQTAKQIVDERVVLEAKRRLAHSDAAVETLAYQLGFSEATNFGKFFARHTGQSPGSFRGAINT